MIPSDIKIALIEQWEKANNLSTPALVNLFDSGSHAEWYLIGMNPNDNDECIGIVCMQTMEFEDISLAELNREVAANGHELKINLNFRPQKAMILWGELKKRRKRLYDRF